MFEVESYNPPRAYQKQAGNALYITIYPFILLSTRISSEILIRTCQGHISKRILPQIVMVSAIFEHELHLQFTIYNMIYHKII